MVSHINISHHLLGGYSRVNASNSTLVDVKVKFETLATPQHEHDGHRQNTRCDHESGNHHHPIRIWFLFGFTLEGEHYLRFTNPK
jgi:hypothetical protein